MNWCWKNRRLLELTSTQNKELNELNKNLEEKVSKRTLEIRQKNTELEEANQKLEKSFLDIIEEIASKIILLGAYRKYDINVVTKLIKIVKKAKLSEKEIKEQKQDVWISYNELKEGMVLAQDIRLKDGRILLASSTKVKKASINYVQKLGENKLIDDRIYVLD